MCRTHNSAAYIQGQGHNRGSYPSVCVRSISPEPFQRFSLNFTKIFLSVRRFAESISRLHRNKVTLQGHGINPSGSCSLISAESFEQLLLNFTLMFVSVRCHAESLTQLCRLEVTLQLMGYILEFRVRSISPEPFG